MFYFVKLWLRDDAQQEQIQICLTFAIIFYAKLSEF